MNEQHNSLITGVERPIEQRDGYSTDIGTLNTPLFDNEDAACLISPQEASQAIGKHQKPFFPERGEPTREAKIQCLGCAVIEECLEFAIDNNVKYGIWGGLSERQRRKVWKAQVEKDKETSRQLVRNMWATDASKFGVPVRILVGKPITALA